MRAMQDLTKGSKSSHHHEKRLLFASLLLVFPFFWWLSGFPGTGRPHSTSVGRSVSTELSLGSHSPR